MIIDARSLPENETIETDICLVGAGIAGITLARELIGQDYKVCLLESGGLESDRVTQSLYYGENIGHPYYELDTARTRFFGGTSHRWIIDIGENRLGVRLRPMDPIDFEQRDWIPHSGWPFDKAHLDPYYQRAQTVCQIGPYTYNVDNWQEPHNAASLPFGDGRVKTTMFQFGPRDPFSGQYRDELDRAENITIYLYSNVIGIETTENAATATRLHVACLPGNKFTVLAKIFVLAMGAIEIPRLLLLSNKTQTTGLGNTYDLVGRFFMEHPHLWSGWYVPASPDIFDKTDLYKIRVVDETPVMGKLALTEAVLRREKLANYCVSLHPAPLPLGMRYPAKSSKGIESLKMLRSAARKKKAPPDFGGHLGHIVSDIGGISSAIYRKAQVKLHKNLPAAEKIGAFKLNHMSEQVPNPESRVTLADEKDALGQNRVRLNWQLSPLDIRTISRAQEIIDEELRRAALGYLHIKLKGETPPLDLHGGWHHMGTTRMHADPKQGVVDENCRIHSVSNLFIAGASVFPTGGFANPVLTFVALTLRLADHIKKIM